MAGRKKENFFGRSGLHHLSSIGSDPSPARQYTQVQRLQVSEGIIGPLDEKDSFPGLHLIAVIQCPHLELGPLDSALLQDGNRLIDATEKRRALSEHLHR